MAKIGILSMQRIKNYGSFLQAYALKSILNELEHDVQFVDYRVEEPLIKENKEANKFKKGLETFKYDGKIRHKIQYILYKNNFGKKYYKMLGLTKEPNYTPVLDTLVIGSDEVFNCIQKNKNVGYSLELFGKNNKAKKVITYAASFGNTTIEKLKRYNKIDEISNLLSNINSISVRDNNSKDIVERITNKKTTINLDPVLIYDYIGKCKEIPEIKQKKKYIIVYAYNGRISKIESEIIKKYAKKNNLKIYSIGGIQNCTDKFINCSPFEVLSYFRNAECVITDTFHGTIFSVITHRKFATIIRKSTGNEYGNEEKLSDLLKRLNLSNRILNNVEDIDSLLNSDINYEKTDEIILKERIKSYDYLKENI